MAYKAKQPRVYISQRGGRKKIYQNKYIYLQNGDEFDIEIENPTKKTICAEIELDGKLISTSRIVVNPGERFLLERFIDENRKFKFNTYQIDGSDSEMKEAISENGKLRVRFYKEKEVQKLCNPCIWINQPYTYPYNGNPTINNPGTGSPYWYDGSTFTTNGSDSTITLDNAGDKTFPSNINYSSADFGSSQSNFMSNTGMSLGDLGLDQILEDRFEEKSKSVNKDSLETGRVGKGQSTDQTFEYVDIDFETSSFHTTDLQILPESRKPVSKKTQNKVFCHKCGTKANIGHNFCAKCGAELYK
jgi:ribosomal protein L40E